VPATATGFEIATPFKFPIGFICGRNMCSVGLQLNDSLGTNPSASQALQFVSHDGGGTPHTAQLNSDASGNMIVTPNVTSPTANPAQAGFVRLASSDAIFWRNNANGADVGIGKNASDQFTFTAAILSPSLLTPTLTGVTNGTGLQMLNSSTTCTTGASVGATCTTAAITLPVAYSDTNYRMSCTGLGSTNVPIVQTYTKSNTTFTITIAALTAAAASFSSYDCIAAHN
jgi:hypothetical protein